MSNNYPIYVQVYVEIKSSKLNKPFTYGVGEDLVRSVYVGAPVRVPFGKRTITGFVSEISEFPPPSSDKFDVKAVLQVIESGSLWDSEMIELARWMESYYGSTYVGSLKAMIPAAARPDKEGKISHSRSVKKVLVKNIPDAAEFEALERRAPLQGKLLRYLSERKGTVEISDLSSLAENPLPALKSLEKKGFVEVFSEAPKEKFFHNYPTKTTGSLPFTPDQQRAFDGLMDLYREPEARVALLHGVTGSGKTEIYLQMIEEVLRDGKEAVVLVPEISLTPQAIERFVGRFGEDIAILHSQMTPAERRNMWQKIRDKKVRIVLGARSAIFAPLENIGVIIVDEEHESSYKQESEPRYHARQVAIRRAFFHECLVVLGSATPSFEVYHWAKEGKYKYFELPRRVGLSSLPEIEIVNLKEDFDSGGNKSNIKEKIIGNTLQRELERALGRGEQAILFINRRGFSSFLLCLDCGNTIHCPYCDVTLTYHKVDYSLKCHHCGYGRTAPDLCPVCGGNRLTMPSFGIQKVEEELRDCFPGVNVLRMDRDTTSGRDAHYRLLKEFSMRKASILLGTQMVAKGLDFPGVTLVGVMLADVSLHLPDFRSIERTYQILTQVAGRAGRRESPGKVVIQTFNPDYPVFAAVKEQNFDEFYRWEAENRRKLNYPPFSHIINILFSGKDSERVREYALRIFDILSSKNVKNNFIAVLGPAPCPLSRVKSLYRWHITLKGGSIRKMMKILKSVAKNLPSPQDVAFFCDVDPLSLM